jgi:hypothetical protein
VSLKAFHLLFIIVSAMLAVFVAAWATGQYRVDPALSYAATVVGAVVLAGSLVAYGAKFQQKTKRM